MRHNKRNFMAGILTVCLLSVMIFTAVGCVKNGSPKQPEKTDEVAPKDGAETNLRDIYATNEDPAPTADGDTEASYTDEVTPATEDETPVQKYVVVLDPGHGGNQSGASHFGRTEKNITLELAGYVRDYLEENYPEIEVHLTREADKGLSEDLVEDLELRCEFARSVNANMLVSLHFNASDSHNRYGATVYISRRDNVHDESEKLARKILDELVALGLDDDGVLTRDSGDKFDEDGVPYDYYAINRHSAARDLVGIIVEHCFMDNEGDSSFVATEEGLRSLAEADARGIAQYLGLK